MFSFTVCHKSIPVMKTKLERMLSQMDDQSLLAGDSYAVTSDVKLDNWSLFCRAAVYGTPIKVTRENSGDLWKLAREFGFHGLDKELQALGYEVTPIVEQREIPVQEDRKPNWDGVQPEVITRMQETVDDQAIRMEGLCTEFRTAYQLMEETEKEKLKAIEKVEAMEARVFELERQLRDERSKRAHTDSVVADLREKLEQIMSGAVAVAPSQPVTLVAKPGECTIAQSDEPRLQHCWYCETCQVKDLFICDSCAKACHDGHTLTDAGMKEIVCGCGLRKHFLCKLMPAKCTYEITGTAYCMQRAYRCMSCGLTGNYCICEACAKTCHAGHKVMDSGVMNMFCDCGTGTLCQCHLTGKSPSG